MNNTIINKSRYIKSQYPLDAKLWVKNTSELIDLGQNNEKVYSYYKGMLAYDINTDKIYRWVIWDKTQSIPGLLTDGFTYPACHTNDYYDYSNKTFNFVETNIGLIDESAYDEALWAKIGTGPEDMFSTITDAVGIGFNHFYFSEPYTWDGSELESILPDKNYFSGDDFTIDNPFVLNKDFVFIDIKLLTINPGTIFSANNLELYNVNDVNLPLVVNGTLLVINSIINELSANGTDTKNILNSTISTFITSLGTTFNNIINNNFDNWNIAEILPLDRFIGNIINSNLAFLPTGKFIQSNDFNITNTNNKIFQIPSYGRATNNNFGDNSTITLEAQSISYFTENNGGTLIINDIGMSIVNNNYFNPITDNRTSGNILSYKFIASDVIVTDGTNSNVELIARKVSDILTSALPNTDYASVTAIRAYVDSRVVGALHYVGTTNASTGVYPTVGSGISNIVSKGDTYIINVAGTLGGIDYQVGDFIIANIDNPGQTSTNWDNVNTNITYIPEDRDNKITTIDVSSTDVQYPSAKAVYIKLNLKADKSNVLQLDNTTPFTPNNDYEPATKKFVEDSLLSYDVSFGTIVPSVYDNAGGTVTPQKMFWQRIGSNINFFSTINLTGYIASNTYNVKLITPQPATFNTQYDLAGLISSGDSSIAGYLQADTINDTIIIHFTGVTTASIRISGAYEIS